MIVFRSWTTNRDAKLDEAGRKIFKRWVGWFLFGFIPLYIKEVKVVHSNLYMPERDF